MEHEKKRRCTITRAAGVFRNHHRPPKGAHRPSVSFLETVASGPWTQITVGAVVAPSELEGLSL